MAKAYGPDPLSCACCPVRRENDDDGAAICVVFLQLCSDPRRAVHALRSADRLHSLCNLTVQPSVHRHSRHIRWSRQDRHRKRFWCTARRVARASEKSRRVAEGWQAGGGAARGVKRSRERAHLEPASHFTPCTAEHEVGHVDERFSSPSERRFRVRDRLGPPEGVPRRRTRRRATARTGPESIRVWRRRRRRRGHLHGERNERSRRESDVRLRASRDGYWRGTGRSRRV